MIVGVDYYPEHWDRQLWEADAELMAKTGVKAVRMAEFAWSRLEPREGEYELDWLDEAVELFAKRGIDVILCTPTSCPPLWFYEKYPDSVRTDAEGKRIAIGIRGHRCIASPDFLRYADRIVNVLTEHFAKNKAVKAWQIDNELEADICFCGVCESGFREYVKNKYGTLESVNAAYGNNVWSGEYSSWEQIKPPSGSYPHAWLNPAYMLDVKRYASHRVARFIRRQADIIRKNCPDAVITTNTWFCEALPDFYEEFSQLDVVSFDNYPPLNIPDDPEELYSHAFHLDLMRGIKRKNFMIMEQLSGGMGCWSPMSRTAAPNMIKGYSLQAFAHGADAVLHFRWRTAVSGAEMHWHGLIDHSNIPGRRFAEFGQLCQTAKELEKLRGTAVRSRAALLYSPESEFAFKIQPQTQGMYYLEQLRLLHRALCSYGLNTDIIEYGEPLDGYDIVAAPTLYVRNVKGEAELDKFVKNGGTLILTDRCGVKDEHNNCIMSPLPSGFTELAGIRVSEYDPLGYSAVTVRMDSKEYRCTRWCDSLQTDTAVPLAEYADGYFKGSCAVSENVIGKGRVYYIGTVGGREFYSDLTGYILEKAHIPNLGLLPDGIEVTEREGKDIRARFIFNNSKNAAEFCLEGKAFALAPFEMRIEIINE